ncbi:MAG: Ig-like domain-containing protein, partial [Anaerolineaceae bacterium]
RGPRGFDAKLKPEITAPGVAIFAAAMGSGSEGVSMGGTSMAAPHVAGVAALMKEAHPDWSVEQIKAAMMSTADDLNVSSTASYRVVPRTGAGRVNAFDSVFTETIATGDPKLVSLSWGVIEYGDQTANYIVPEAKMVRLQNLGAADETYDISVVFTDAMPDAGATLDVPPSVTVTAGSTGFVPVSLTLHPLAMSFTKLEEYYGFIFFTPQTGGDAVRVPFFFVPRPFNALSNITGDSIVPSDGVTPAIKFFDVTGSTISSLFVFPLVGTDLNEADVKDRGDLRAVGMDYGGSTGYGEILSVAFNTWGAVHTPQPYYSENDLYLDVDQDGVDDYVYFNFNSGWFTGGDENNTWIIVVVSLSEGWMDLASPYTIYADYNSGLMEWYLPDSYAYFDFDTANSIIDYSVISFDGAGGVDEGPVGTFDYLNSPFAFGFIDDAPMGGVTTAMGVWTNDHASYMVSKPQGALLIDYNGKPGYGQAYPLLFSIENAAPIGVDDAFTTDEDVLLVGDVLTNDSDPDGDLLTVDLVTPPAHGTLVLNANGNFEYTPDQDWNGNDSFVYQNSDSLLTSNPTTVSITVTPVNDASVADDQTLTVAEDAVLTGTLTATDVDSTVMTFAQG